MLIKEDNAVKKFAYVIALLNLVVFFIKTEGKNFNWFSLQPERGKDIARRQLLLGGLLRVKAVRKQISPLKRDWIIN